MKKKIFGALVVAIAVGAMMNVNLNKTSNKGDLAMTNMEALAQESSGTSGRGTKVTSDITCTIFLSVSETRWVSDAVSYGGGLGGNVTIPGGSALWGASGNLGGQGSNSSGHWETTASIKSTTIKGHLIGCPGTNPSSCASYNPCS